MALILETSRTSILTTPDIVRVGGHLKIRLQPSGLSSARLGLRHQVWEGGQDPALPKIIASPHTNIVRDHTFGYDRRRRYHWHRLGCNHKHLLALKRSNIVPSGNINLRTADEGGVGFPGPRIYPDGPGAFATEIHPSGPGCVIVVQTFIRQSLACSQPAERPTGVRDLKIVDPPSAIRSWGKMC